MDGEKCAILKNDEERSDKMTYLKHYDFTIGVLTGAVVLCRGKTENRIRDNETKGKELSILKKLSSPFEKKTFHNPFQKDQGELRTHQNSASCNI